jgi:hypothetical protein
LTRPDPSVNDSLKNCAKPLWKPHRELNEQSVVTLPAPCVKEIQKHFLRALQSAVPGILLWMTFIFSSAILPACSKSEPLAGSLWSPADDAAAMCPHA